MVQIWAKEWSVESQGVWDGDSFIMRTTRR